MKFRMIIFILVFVFAMTGCKNGGNGESKVPLDTVIQTMENRGLKLLLIHQKDDPSFFEKLNNVVAVTYAIDTHSMGGVTNEVEVDSSHSAIVNVFVYVFDSEEARSEGRKDLNEKLKLISLASPPGVYENKNVMVVHFKYTDELTEYDDMIKKAVNEL